MWSIINLYKYPDVHIAIHIMTAMLSYTYVSGTYALSSTIIVMLV